MAKAPHCRGGRAGLLPRVIQCPRTGRQAGLELQEGQGAHTLPCRPSHLPLCLPPPWAAGSAGPLPVAQDSPKGGGWAAWVWEGDQDCSALLFGATPPAWRASTTKAGTSLPTALK